MLCYMLCNSNFQMVYDKLNYLFVAVLLIQVVVSPVVLQLYSHLDLIKLYRLCVGCGERLLKFNYLIFFSLFYNKVNLPINFNFFVCLEPSKCNFICAFDVTTISQILQNLDGSLITFSGVVFGDVGF